MMKALHENQIRTLADRLELSLKTYVRKLGCSMPKVDVNPYDESTP